MSIDSDSPIDQTLNAEFLPLHLIRDSPMRRDLTSVNVQWSWKERFDRMQDLLSGRLGRRLTQWETFALVVAVAEERFEQELYALRGR